jgi:hypothetical protein
MSEKEETVKVQTATPADLFEGIKGRRPKTTKELDEWLASDEGKASTMFELTSASPLGERGRS